jgi:large subunit ribosomal protein L3
MSNGIIGKKLGMTSVFDGIGNHIPCTVIQTDGNVVTQLRTEERDGYSAVQLAFGDKKVKKTSKALQGHFEAAGTGPKRKVKEFANLNEDLSLGDEVNVEDLFQEGELIDVTGVSKGKGFQGVVKRHGFSGVGMKTHGQHNRQRAPGSIGASSDPSRVFKGTRMAGRMGGKQVTTKNLRVVQILPDHGVILVRGAVPGPKNGFVEIRKNTKFK